jgi:hypothetical protein
MAKTKRYYPEELVSWRSSFRYWCRPWKKKIKREMREHRKVMKDKEISDGKEFNKRASDEWHFN